jgi:hypothetical protein
MFGSNKTVRVKVQKDYTPEEFYELIKDHPFAAGKPEKIRYMMTDRIVFPALDKQNQVQILKTGQKTWSVWKSEEAKVESAVMNGALFGAFGWLANIPAMFSENAKKCKELVDATAKDLEAMNL